MSTLMERRWHELDVKHRVSGLGIKEPLMLLNGQDILGEKEVKRGGFWVIRYLGNYKEICLNFREEIHRPIREDENPIRGEPGDFIFIMTKKWTLVARPEPQATIENVESQACVIWRTAKTIFEMEKSDETQNKSMVCWVFVPLREENDFGPSCVPPVKERENSYMTVFLLGMNNIDWLEQKVFVQKGYTFGKTSGLEQSAKFQCRICIHDRKTAFNFYTDRNTAHNDFYTDPENDEANRRRLKNNSIDYLRKGFPPISVIPEVTQRSPNVTLPVSKELFIYTGPLE